MAQSKLDDAIAHYHDSVAVAKRFATKGNDTTQEQRNLVLSLHKIGDAQVMKGKLSDAVLAYHESLAMTAHGRSICFCRT